MKKIFLSFLFLLAIGNTLFAQNQEEKAVRSAFEKYRSDLLNDLGEEAFKDIDSRTIKYYEDLLGWIQNSDSLEIESFSVLDKMTVLIMRNKMPKEDLLAMNGKKLFVYAVNNGMVGKGSVANNTIGKIAVNGNFASGQFISKGRETEVYFHFYKEDGAWKVDLTSLFPISIMLFDKMIADSGKSENEFLIPLIEASTAKKLDPTSWKPLH